jgi:hypothetical protein
VPPGSTWRRIVGSIVLIAASVLFISWTDRGFEWTAEGLGELAFYLLALSLGGLLVWSSFRRGPD